MLRIINVGCVLLLMASYAAASLNVLMREVDNSAALSGYKTWDVTLITDTEWLDTEMLIDLSAGSIYQNLNGSNLPPDPAGFSGNSALKFDSFVTAGSTDYGSDPEIIGGAVDLGGGIPAVLDTAGMDITWCPVSTGNVGELCIARITLSDSSAGTMYMRVANPTDGVRQFDTEITTGVLVGPPLITEYVPGDANEDGKVNEADASIIAQNWLTSNASWQDGDFNFDHVVNEVDATMMAANWFTAGVGATVPEPAMIYYVFMLSLGLLGVYRKITRK